MNSSDYNAYAAPDAVTTAVAAAAGRGGHRGITLTELLLVEGHVPGKYGARLDVKRATRARGIKRRRQRDNNLRRAGSLCLLEIRNLLTPLISC
jgi:hypothetical protein